MENTNENNAVTVDSISNIIKNNSNQPSNTYMLKLKSKRNQASRHITWDNNVKDFKGQRTSKSCCVFHKKKIFGESDSDCSSGSDTSPIKPCNRHHCYCNTTFS